MGLTTAGSWSLGMRPRWCLGLALALLGFASGALAQTWPARPIRAIVPFSAGSASDIIPRVVLEQISTQIGHPIVVENRTGASGTIGTAAVAKAEPDGYTILANSGAFTVTPSTVSNLPYDAEKDFTPVAAFAIQAYVLVVAPSKGIRSARELAELGRAKPNSLTYASAGAGSATHLTGEQFRLAGGFEAVHVPFKGGPEAITEVMTGRVDFYFVPVLPALPLLRDGKLLALAVSTAKRSSALPDVPTIIEAGFPDTEFNSWVGMFAPSKTPREIVDRLHAETQKAIAMPEVKARFARLGADPMPMTQPEFADYIRNEIGQMARLVKAARLSRGSGD
jgi:tripartite-type tricarboxylate transporter receptor subunit TctC